jgi:hypothetical protein
MEVDAEAQAFRVPEDKITAFSELLDRLAGQPLTARQAAQVAGKIVAMTLAVTTAPLYARLVLQVARGMDWDTALWEPGEVIRQAQQFVALLRQRNGRATWRKGPALRLATELVGGASDRAYATFLPGKELGAASSMLMPFTAQECESLARNDFSSRERELRALLYSLRWLQKQALELLAGRAVQYQTDSQPASCCVVGMKGNDACLPVVAEIHQMCAETDTDVTVVWYPRTREQQRQADQLSKYEDSSQWMLNQEEYDKLWSEHCLAGRRPCLDVFADEQTTKVPGSFFAASWSLGVRGVDAFAQDWGSREWDNSASRTGSKPLLYINPPAGCCGRWRRSAPTAS